jgi:acetylornithine deacetylase/succinyl-diaminopimelate desuccinylase-like protein
MHQGFGSLDLVVRAKAAHGVADDSPDAIVQLADLVKGLAEIDRELAANPHPEVGKAFFHTAWVRGGTDYGTYPREVTLGFEFGTNPGETLADRLQAIDAVIARTREAHPTLDAEVVVRERAVRRRGARRPARSFRRRDRRGDRRARRA